MWFSILGTEKAHWTYDEEMLLLSVGAATKLHNWMLRHRGLAYNDQDYPRNTYSNVY